MSKRKWLLYLAQYILLLPLGLIIRAMPVDTASALGGLLGQLLGRFLPSNRVAKRNIRAVLGTNKKQTATIANRMWDNLGRNIAELVHLEKFAASITTPTPRITIKGEKKALATAKKHGSVILFSGHFANWEVLQGMLSALGFNGGAVYRHINNPFLNQWLIGKRTTNNTLTQIPKGRKGALSAVDLLSHGKMVALMADQKMNDGIETRFFGIKSKGPASPARLAARFSAPLIPVSIKRENGAHFHVHFHEKLPLRFDKSPAENAKTNMQLVNDFFAKHMKTAPEQWFWVHRRWHKNEVEKRLRNK